MIVSNQVREQLAGYLAGEQSFAQFEDWLIQHSYNMHKDSPQEAQRLVHEINSAVYEYLDDFIDENRLKRELSQHIRHYEVVIAFDNVSQPQAVEPSQSSPAEKHLVAFSSR